MFDLLEEIKNPVEESLVIDRFGYFIDYPADQLWESIISNIFTEKYDQMPSPVLPLWLGITKYVEIICFNLLACLVIMILAKRKIKKN